MSRPGLLVSVRSAAEARSALAGGADLIDVKEPTRGPLGRADDATIREVVGAVEGRRPVSAALGEWRDDRAEPIPSGLTFVKWGLAGYRSEWLKAVANVRMTTIAGPVLVAYADWERADSPPPEALVELACQQAFAVFLIDTAVKDGTTLLDWVGASRLKALCDRLRAGGVRIALAGSLDTHGIRGLLDLRPDWFAVRGAACIGGREGTVCPDRVRALRNIIDGRETA